MPANDAFEKRGASLENAFYAQLDSKLLDDLRAQNRANGDVAELRKVTGLSSNDTLAALQHCGVNAQSAAALRLVPLVEVAWGNGRIDANEKREVQRAAHEHGIDKDSSTGQLLNAWLESQPPAELMDAWIAYARELVKQMDPEAATNLRESLAQEMKEVAQASGGLLGYAAVSKGESKVMQQVLDALTLNS
jgi:hypothetical protein